MRFIQHLLFIFFLFSLICLEANTSIWQGEVSSDGNPSPVVRLKLGHKYQIQVTGTINLGKWRRNGDALEDDACFEFAKNNTTPSAIFTFKNSMNVSLCDGHFHPSHVYLSAPFLAAQNGIHFWVHDDDYENNSGSFQVQVIELEVPPSAPPSLK
jgi:hypothetical protein